MNLGDRVKITESIYTSDKLQAGGFGIITEVSTFFGNPGFKVVVEGDEDGGPFRRGAWNFAASQLELA